MFPFLPSLLPPLRSPNLSSPSSPPPGVSSCIPPVFSFSSSSSSLSFSLSSSLSLSSVPSSVPLPFDSLHIIHSTHKQEGKSFLRTEGEEKRKKKKKEKRERKEKKKTRIVLDVGLVDAGALEEVEEETRAIVDENAVGLFLKPWVANYVWEKYSSISLPLFLEIKWKELHNVGGNLLHQFLPHQVHTFLSADLLRESIQCLNDSEMKQVLLRLLDILLSAIYSAYPRPLLTMQDYLNFLKKQDIAHENVIAEKEFLKLSNNSVWNLSPFYEHLDAELKMQGQFDEIGLENDDTMMQQIKNGDQSRCMQKGDEFAVQHQDYLAIDEKLHSSKIMNPAEEKTASNQQNVNAHFAKKILPKIVEKIGSLLQNSDNFKDKRGAALTGNNEPYHMGFLRLKQVALDLLSEKNEFALKSAGSTDILRKIKGIFKRKMDQSSLFSSRFIRKAMFLEWKFFAFSRKKNFLIILAKNI